MHSSNTYEAMVFFHDLILYLILFISAWCWYLEVEVRVVMPDERAGASGPGRPSESV
jgi:hypothetical protein